MHPYKRSERIGELILVEIADVIAREIKDPRIGFVTFTRVEMSDDLRHAKVFVSFGAEEEKARTLPGPLQRDGIYSPPSGAGTTPALYSGDLLPA